jgi:hypothetical protein
MAKGDELELLMYCGRLQAEARTAREALAIAERKLAEQTTLTTEGRANAIALGDWLFEHHPTGEPDIAKAALTALKHLTRGTE